MHACRIDSDEAGRPMGPVPQLRRREACAYLACAGFAVWPVSGHADVAPLQRGREEFGELVIDAARLALHERVAFLNSWVNELVEPRADDPAHDHWATPYETLARGAGDCEDSAITKFFLLLASGAPGAGVRLLYAWQTPNDGVSGPVSDRVSDRVGGLPARRRAHMVAVVRWPFEDPWVLDSIDVLARPLSRREDIVPVFSFDEQHLWRRLDAQALAPPRDRLRPWQALLGRWRAQSAH